jgi:ABC-type hemin transport system substrate-binding protein
VTFVHTCQRPDPRHSHAIPAGTYPCLVRLVSLLPSATEIVYALGLGEDLVGVTFECDEPPAAHDYFLLPAGGTPAG